MKWAFSPTPLISSDFLVLPICNIFGLWIDTVKIIARMYVLDFSDIQIFALKLMEVR